LQDLLAALQTALGFGLQYEPLAAIALATLERWERQRPQVQICCMPVNPYMTPPVVSRSANAAIAVVTLEPRAAARAQLDVNPEITSKVHALTDQQRISRKIPGNDWP